MTQLQHSIRQAHDETVCQVYTCDDEGTCKPAQQESSGLSEADWAFMMISLEANESDGRGADINIIADKASSTHATKVFTCLEIGGTSVKFQLDTGASCNIIGRHHLPTKIELHPTSKVLTMYNRSTIIPLGLHQTIVRNPKTNTKHSVEFVVIEAADSIPLLRARTCQAMNLIVICYDNMQTNAWTGTDRINAVQSSRTSGNANVCHETKGALSRRSIRRNVNKSRPFELFGDEAL